MDSNIARGSEVLSTNIAKQLTVTNVKEMFGKPKQAPLSYNTLLTLQVPEQLLRFIPVARLIATHKKTSWF